MSPPSHKKQVEFLTNLQRLLAEGQFTATYKYALLLALADIAVEIGDDSGEPLTVSSRTIGDKFIHYYWRQVVPYVPRSDPTAGQILRQNTGDPPEIFKPILEARHHFDSLAKAKRETKNWSKLTTKVSATVRKQPLWKLQTVGGSTFDFLYENCGKGTSIELRAGVVFCLRQFYGLIGDLVRGAWLRYIRRHNHDLLGTTADLVEFMFGSERSDLSAIRGILEDVQACRCFYCEETMRRHTGHVDHFIPWSKYPLDLGHNFVLAHQKCNSKKADHLAAADFLAGWADRNQQHREQLAVEFCERGVLHDLPTSVRIASWAYETTFEAGGLTWLRNDDMVALPDDWQQPLAQLLESST